MGKEYPTRSFKSGNSVAIRLPAALGIEPDGDWLVEQVDGVLHMRKVPVAPKRIDLTGIYGVGAGLTPLSPEDRVFEERELDWTGEKLPQRD